jgi:hypothetical protein
MLVYVRAQTMITDNLLLGGREEAENAGLLLDMGVTHVLNTAQQLPCYFPQQFVYLKIGLIGTPRRCGLLIGFSPNVCVFTSSCAQMPRTRAWWTSRTVW